MRIFIKSTSECTGNILYKAHVQIYKPTPKFEIFAHFYTILEIHFLYGPPTIFHFLDRQAHGLNRECYGYMVTFNRECYGYMVTLIIYYNNINSSSP